MALAATERIGRTELIKLIEIGQRLASTIDLAKLLEIVLDSAQKLTNAEASSLLLLDEKLGKLRFAVTTGRAAKSLRSLTVPLDEESIAGSVAKSAKPLIVADVRQDPKWYALTDKQTGFETRSIIAVPLLLERRAVGVVEVLNRRDHAGFTTEDLQLLEYLAQQASLALRNARAYQELLESRQSLIDEQEPRYRIIGQSGAIRDSLALAQQVASTGTTVLIRGESGTGKELLARQIHRLSPRRGGPFTIVNCAAIPTTLIESELFGYERGAFTGAATRKPGKFELSHNGTAFMDEIGDIGLETQIKILRFLEGREFQRLGGKDPITVDVRIVTATNQNLEDLVKQKRFREDLYYRLNVFPIELAPLRDRKEDIPPLVSHFLTLFNTETAKQVQSVTPAALDVLMAYSWPGNIRELRNVLERGFVLTPGAEIRPEHLIISPGFAEGVMGASDKKGWIDAVGEFKRGYLLRVLKQTQGNHRKAAQILGIQPSYLSRLKKELGLELP